MSRLALEAMKVKETEEIAEVGASIVENLIELVA